MNKNKNTLRYFCSSSCPKISPSPCRPSWWWCRARWGTSESGYPSCSGPRLPRSCPSDPYPPSHPDNEGNTSQNLRNKNRQLVVKLQKCHLSEIFQKLTALSVFLPGDGGVQQWMGRQHGERHHRQTQPWPGQSRCRTPRRWSHRRRTCLIFSGLAFCTRRRTGQQAKHQFVKFTGMFYFVWIRSFYLTVFTSKHRTLFAFFKVLNKASIALC